MAQPVCPLCREQRNARRFSERGYDLRVCDCCGLLFIDPYPSSEENRHETVKSYTFDEHLAVTDAQKHYEAERRYYQRYFPLIAEQCRGARSFLDVGCGTGHLLQLLQQTYPQISRAGIELNASRAEMARRNAQCEIFELPVEEFQSERTFDVITMINVLSHIPSFDSLFTALQRLLSPQGKLILKIGEVFREAEQGDLFDWGIPDHLHFCGFETMEYLAAKYRFSISWQRRIPYSDECFNKARWQSPGNSPLRNMLKSVVVHTPFALPMLAKLYNLRHGGKIRSSFFVLSKERQTA